MTIIIYKFDGDKKTEFARWYNGEVTSTETGMVTEMSREDVIHECNNVYYLTNEIED